MNLKKRWAARQARKSQQAWDRLHGKGAVSVPPRRRKRRGSIGVGAGGSSGDSFGDWMVWDAISDLVSDLIEALFKIFD